MARGKTSNPGSVMIYGRPRRTRSPDRLPWRAEARIRRLLETGQDDLGKLMRALGDDELQAGSDIEEMSLLATHLAARLGDPGLADPSAGEVLEEARATADTILFRAFHRLGQEAAGDLLSARFADDIRASRGAAYLAERIDQLMLSPRVSAREDPVVLKRDDSLDGVAYLTHYRDATHQRPACQEGEVGPGSHLHAPWRSLRWVRPSCRDCRQVFTEDPGRVEHRSRAGMDELSIHRDKIVLGATRAARERLAAAPLAVADQAEAWRRSLWEAWVSVMVRETRDASGVSPLGIRRVKERLEAFWDPRLQGPPIELPALLI